MNEQVFTQKDAQLYIFDKNKITGQKEWKQRASTANIWILKRKERDQCQLVMHHGLTKTIVLNHWLVSGLNLADHLVTDNAFLWCAEDYAFGKKKYTTFGVRFKDGQLANHFKDAFKLYQKQVVVAPEELKCEDEENP